MQIQISDAHPGMALLSDIHLPDGTTFKGQQKITQEMVSLIEKSGIKQIDVVPFNVPSLTLHIDRDCFSASLTIEPHNSPDEFITVEILKNCLEKNDIRYGVDENLLKTVTEKWAENKRRYEISKIAVGKRPEPAKEGPLRMKVKSILERSVYEEIKISKAYWQIAHIASQYQKVLPGTEIAEKEIEKQAIPGLNIKGEQVITHEVIKSPLMLGNGATLSKDNKVISTTTGYAFLVDGLVGVLEIDFDGSVEIVVKDDLLSAELIVHAPGEGGKMPGEKEITSLLESNRIVFGVHGEVLKKLIFGFTKNEFPSEPVVIAEGIRPCNGGNGKLEFLFNTETSLKPKENPDGSVDFKNVSIIIPAAKGEKLVKLIPPKKGTPGKNIRGEIVTCTDGLPSKLPVGLNTSIDSSDPSYLIATTDGVVRYNGSTVDISEGLVIKGDIDFSTGHIKYQKSVVVTGDVKGGFNIECGGDLQVGGVIEDCRITVGGSVLCKYGFVGQGKGVLEAKGNVNLGFMKNQTVKSRMDVNIAREALNCNIYARRKIQVHGNPLSVAGGVLVARDAIILYTVGNHSGIRTIIEVGIDFTLVEELEKTENTLKEFTVNYSKLMESHTKYTKLIAAKGRLSAQEQNIMDKLVVSIAKYQQEINALEARKKLIQKKMYYLDIAYVKVEHSAYPGTLFKFGERYYLVKDETIGPKTVRLIDHEIKIL